MWAQQERASCQRKEDPWARSPGSHREKSMKWEKEVAQDAFLRHILMSGLCEENEPLKAEKAQAERQKQPSRVGTVQSRDWERCQEGSELEWALVCNRLVTSESGSSTAGWRSDGRDVMREGRMRGSVSSKEF